ncbi:acyl-CoA thioesterase [Hydrogenimonas sp.]
MASKIFRYEFEVGEEAIDFNGHVGNVTYLQWMVEAAQAHSEAAGWKMAACKEAGGTWFARSHKIEYLHPAYARDRLRMETWIEEIGTVRALRRYRILKLPEERVLCEGESEWIFVDAETMRPRRIPPAIAAAFSAETP